MCVHVGAYRDQRGHLIPLGLQEYQVAVTCLSWVPGTELGHSQRAAHEMCALHH